MQLRRLVFDIETAAHDLASFDDYSQRALDQLSEREEDAEEEAFRFAFSPLTAQVVTIAALDADTGRGSVWVNGSLRAFEENGVSFESCDERSLLEKFWEHARTYDEFITFNGRTFDVPFLMIRSAILGVKPTKNLMGNRYLSLQPSNARHIDLKDQFTFYGAKKERLGLHFWCVAFGIPSPKVGEVTGEDVTRLWRAGEHEKIARYCLGDTIATAALFRKWEQFLRF
jgi:DNA polymerase elongation subunit (family B)